MQRLVQTLPTSFRVAHNLLRPSLPVNIASRLPQNIRHFAAPSHPGLTKELNDKTISHLGNAVKRQESLEERWRQKSKQALEDAANRPPADPYAGRTVRVGKDVADAYRKLETILQRNRVRPELKMTQRHEKKGVKRRRLSSQRWREQFANEVSLVRL
ncbi:hypothetical protein CVT24_012788 [Panaeolus cyanescens]|uniref:Uncharacterized protein n=1 Tax=Panaeolus cyanescens TaxID=181874 RepID=A0A409WKP2_9AGAR|nr:hypothetical protein CVT24_012788 [Panaeolus cyanescens]